MENKGIIESVKDSLSVDEKTKMVFNIMNMNRHARRAFAKHNGIQKVSGINDKVIGHKTRAKMQKNSI